VIRALTAIGAITFALAVASCARNESHGKHADHAGHEPADKVELDTPAAPAPVTVEPTREAAAPVATATPIEPDKTIAEKPTAKRKAALRPKPTPKAESDASRPAPPTPAPTVPAPADEHAGHDSHQHHHH
jgi:hypothetical protein